MSLLHGALAGSSALLLLVGLAGSGRNDLNEDRRLFAPISIARSRIHLGELLEVLRSQTRVELRADDRMCPVSGVELTVQLNQRSTRSVMSALVELMSQPDQRWSWRREGSAWVFGPQRSFTAAADLARGQISAQFADRVREILRIEALPPAAREPAATARPDLFPGGADSPKAAILRRIPFAKLARAFQGQTVSLEPAEIGDAGFNAFTIREPLASNRSTGPAQIRLDWGPTSLTPTLLIDLGSGSSTNLVGNRTWDFSVLKSLHPDWLNPGSPEVVGLRTALQAGGAIGFKRVAVRDPGVRALVHTTAQSAPLDILVDWVAPDPRAPSDRQALISADQAATMRALCGKLLRFEVFEKSSPFLLRPQTSMLQTRAHLVPWPTIKRLRAWAPIGEPPTLEALALTPSLTSAQMEGLRDEFPYLTPNFVEEWVPLLRFRQTLNRSLQMKLASPEGVRLRELDLNSRKTLAAARDESKFIGVATMEAIGPEAALSLRLAAKKPLIALPEDRNTAPAQIAMLTWKITHEGKTVHRRDILLAPRKPLEPESAPQRN